MLCDKGSVVGVGGRHSYAWCPPSRNYSVTRRNTTHRNSAGTLPALADLRQNTTRVYKKIAFGMPATRRWLSHSLALRTFSRRFCGRENACGAMRCVMMETVL